VKLIILHWIIIGIQLKHRELLGKEMILLVNEGAILFGVDVGGVSFSADGVEFVEEVADVGVDSGGYGGGVVGE